MWRVQVRRDFDDEDAVAAAASSYPILGIEFEHQDDGLTEFLIWLRDGGAAARLAAELGGEAAQADEPVALAPPLDPLAVGATWWLTPPGWTGPAPEGRRPIEFRTGNSFGHGDHPATQLCLVALERHFGAGERFLDVGCGLGLLVEAARRLGASQSWGCDPDPVAAPDWFGSVDAVREQAVDCAVANLPVGVLRELWPELERVVRGTLVISGFLEDQEAELPGAPGWVLVDRMTLAGWGCMVWKRIHKR